MHRRTLIGAALVLALAGMPAAAFAQESEPTVREKERLQAAQEMERQQAAQEKERARAQEQEKREREQPPSPGNVNIRLEVTIRDQRGAASPTTKTVSMVVTDRILGKIRTTGAVQTEKFGMQNAVLNVDARPVFIRDNIIRVSLTLEYRPADTAGSFAPNVSETIDTILENGKPLVVSRSADPDSDRSVTVELKATILK
jgi:hemolysin activation/secretion protein